MIIYNARVITWEDENRVLDNHAVVIQGKLIKDFGPSDEMLKKYPEEEKIDAGGKILMLQHTVKKFYLICNECLFLITVVIRKHTDNIRQCSGIPANCPEPVLAVYTDAIGSPAVVVEMCIIILIVKGIADP